MVCPFFQLKHYYKMKCTSITVSSLYLISYLITTSNGNYFKLSKKFIKLPVLVFQISESTDLKTSEFKSNIALKLSEMSVFCN